MSEEYDYSKSYDLTDLINAALSQIEQDQLEQELNTEKGPVEPE